ncbi:oligosaccharide flippase family protein [Clostridium butyricum]
MDLKKKIFLKNTLFLYILTFSNYLFNFISIPYLTRILGVEFYGKIGFSLAIMAYFQLLLDYGFILSATAEIANNRNDKNKISKIVFNVFWCKNILCIVGFFILCILCMFITRLREDFLLIILYYIGFAINSFLPDFLYRGIEKMKIITIRSVIIKFLFTIMTFGFIHNKEDYLLVPILSIIGNIIALIYVFLDCYKNVGIKFSKPDYRDIFETFKTSTPYFFSRIASTIYSATNTILIGFLYPFGSIVGLFTVADKLIVTSRSCFSPIADSLYPYMVKNKDFKLIKKILKLLVPPIVLVSLIVMIYSKSICSVLFGKEYAEAGIILTLMMPIVIIYLPTYILSFPTLEPLGLGKYANIANIVGAIVHICNLVILYKLNVLNVYTICIVTCITELVVLLFRISVIVLKKKTYLMKEKKNEIKNKRCYD